MVTKLPPIMDTPMPTQASKVDNTYNLLTGSLYGFYTRP